MKKVTLISTSLVVALTACAQWNTDKSPIQVTSTFDCRWKNVYILANCKNGGR